MQGGRSWTPPGFGWLIAAFAACLCVFAINGGPLYYHDSADYLNRGGQVLSVVGLRSPVRIDAVEQVREAAAAGTAAPAPADSGAKTADVSRSVIYALIVGLFAALGALEGVVLLNAAVAVLIVWFPIRIALREFGESASLAGPLAFTAIAAGTAGSLAFYVALLMPDIFAPALLIIAATLTAFAGRMTRGELVFAFLLGSLSVMAHNSHLVIAALLLPFVIAGSLLTGGRRRWLAPALFAGIALIGFGQLQALRLAVAKVEKADAVYLPFLTARLVQDGPGRAYLATHCPDPGIATCALWEALSHSGDPMRFTASHITFQRTARLGSFRLMSEDSQRSVANGQVSFFLAVLRDRPLDTTGAVLRNVGRQLTMNSIDMTLPDAEVRGRFIGKPGLALSSFDSRLHRDDGWIAPANHVQETFYLAALAAILIVSALPATPRRLRAFLLLVLAGLFVNALVCGAVSQPATRYGGRVIWLLPAVAVMALGIGRRCFAPGSRNLSIAGRKTG